MLSDCGSLAWTYRDSIVAMSSFILKTLPLMKRIVDVTGSPEQGYQWTQKRTCVVQKFKKKKNFDKNGPSNADIQPIVTFQKLLAFWAK